MKRIALFFKMGRIFSHFRHDDSDRELIIHVTTGDRKRAGTDANVRMILYDEKGQSTETIKLGHAFKNDHERGSTCTYAASSGHGFGYPLKVRNYLFKLINYINASASAERNLERGKFLEQMCLSKMFFN